MGVNGSKLLDHVCKFQICDYAFRLMYYLPVLSPGMLGREHFFQHVSQFIHPYPFYHLTLFNFCNWQNLFKKCKNHPLQFHCFLSDAACSSDSRELEGM
jgi:hypothetical protein